MALATICGQRSCTGQLAGMDTRAGVGGVYPHYPLLKTDSSLLPRCRLRIPPFEKARTVLEALQQRRPVRVKGGTCWETPADGTKGALAILGLRFPFSGM